MVETLFPFAKSTDSRINHPGRYKSVAFVGAVYH
jgi:hypothetical protein